MDMGSSLLIAEDDKTAADFNIKNRSSAWAFIDAMKDSTVKLRVNLIGEDGYDFEYRDGGEIMIDRTVDQMEETLDHWKEQLPPLVDILNYIMADFTNPIYSSDQNIVEDLLGDLDENIEALDLTDIDHRFTRELLEELVRDMYNYIAFAFTYCRLVDEEQLWEFLKVIDAHIRNGKLYITAQIYVDGLRDLDFMDERTDIDFVEIVNGIRGLFVLANESRTNREIYDRDRKMGLARRLLS